MNVANNFRQESKFFSIFLRLKNFFPGNWLFKLKGWLEKNLDQKYPELEKRNNELTCGQFYEAQFISNFIQ